MNSCDYYSMGVREGQELGKQIILDKVKTALEELRKERDKSYECEATFHGWGMQSAIEIFERHLKEELEHE